MQMRGRQSTLSQCEYRQTSGAVRGAAWSASVKRSHLGEPIEDAKAAWKAPEEMLGSQIEEEQGYDQLRMSCEDDRPSGDACPLDPSRWESSCEQLAKGGETA